MKILHDEFKNWIQSISVCRWKGHQTSDWMEEWWAPAHSTGRKVRVCQRCYKVLEQTLYHKPMMGELTCSENMKKPIE